MKVFFKIICLSILSTSFLFISEVSFAYTFNSVQTCDSDGKNCTNTYIGETTGLKSVDGSIYNGGTSKTNTHLEGIKGDDTKVGEFVASGTRNGDQGIYNMIVRVARDLKNLVFVISTIYFLIIVFKFLFSENAEEELANFKKGIIWISIGIAIMQIAYGFVRTLSVYNGGVIGQPLGQQLFINIIDPLMKIIEMGTSFAFIAVAIYAFYKMVTSNGDDEKAKTGKMTIFYAIIGFIIIKISRAIVETVYGKINCASTNANSFFVFQNDRCIEPANLTRFAQIVLDIINWANGFVGIITLIMIIYAGAQVFLSGGDEEKLKNAKKSILYIIIGLFVLVTNYLILTFFFSPTTTI